MAISALDILPVYDSETSEVIGGFDRTVQRDDSERTAEICENAAKLIEERGWTQDTAVGANGGVCLVEALTRAALDKVIFTSGGADESVRAAFQRALDHMEWTLFGSKTLDEGYNMARWNDRIGRREQEVLDALHTGAKLALNPEADRGDA